MSLILNYYASDVTDRQMKTHLQDHDVKFTFELTYRYNVIFN